MDDHSNEPDAARASALAADLRVLIARLKRRLREQSYLGDLTGSQLSVLGRLERDGPATVTALALAEGMRPQSMGANIAVLESAGLVVGAQDPSDRRQTILSLTPVCLEWLRAGRAARQDWLVQAIQKTLAPEEQASLARALELLRRLADS